MEAARAAGHEVPPLWDGHAAGRIVDVLATLPRPEREASTRGVHS
jgi:hypothetical protein